MPAHDERDGAATCVECAVPQLARNHYFTGKLLVERDFTDEQRFHIGKQRRHNQHLHGWGVACGLKVKEHPKEDCRPQYVLIEPGSAVDCCGREIVLEREARFDFRERLLAGWKKQHGPEAELDTAPHTLQICVRYAECPSEEVPALFDDCGPGETDCQPNRILEARDFDVIIDPEPVVHERASLRLDWRNTVNVPRVDQLALDEDRRRLFAVSAAPATLYVVDMDTHRIVGSRSLAASPAAAQDVAVSADGTRVYAAVGGPSRVLVLDPGDLGANPVNELPLGATAGELRLVPAGDGGLFVLARSDKKLVAWDKAINAAGADLTAARMWDIALAGSPTDMVPSPDGTLLFVTNELAASAGISIVTIATHAVQDVPLTGTVPHALAVASTSAQNTRLYIADAANHSIRIVDATNPVPPDPLPAVGSAVSLGTDVPVDLTVSPGGHWIYALVRRADGTGALQVVDAHEIEVGGAHPLGAALSIGDEPTTVVRTADSTRLYVGYHGTTADASGGAAIVDALEADCDQAIRDLLDGCDTCPDGESLVLATVQNYQAGDALGDARLDNLADRRLLPSTKAITDVLECLVARPAGEGGRGEQGPPGPQGATGPQGPKGDMGAAGAQGQKGDTGAKGDAGAQGLKGDIGAAGPRGPKGDTGATGPIGPQGPKGDKGDSGDSGLDRTLTHICAINWEHRGTMKLADFQQRGLVVAFDWKVVLGDISAPNTEHVFQVFFKEAGAGSLACWCEVPGLLEGLNPLAPEPPQGTCPVIDAQATQPVPAPKEVWAVRFKPKESQLGTYRVVLKGDLVRDLKERGVDADHLPLWVPKRRSGDGIEGGTFESWFTAV